MLLAPRARPRPLTEALWTLLGLPKLPHLSSHRPLAITMTDGLRC